MEAPEKTYLLAYKTTQHSYFLASQLAKAFNSLNRIEFLIHSNIRITYLEEQREGHPLIVAMESSVIFVFISKSRAGDLSSHFLPVLAW